MDFVVSLFNETFFRPLLNALVFLTGVLPFHDLGFAVIILTILVRLALFPFTHHSVKAQTKMRVLEPEIAQIRETHKNNQEEQARRIMALYKQHGVNPFSGCLMLLIQLPLLIALYQVFLVKVQDMGQYLYLFIQMPPVIHTVFLGFINLMEMSIFVAVLAALTQFIQMKLAVPKTASVPASSIGPDFARMMTMQMTYVMPVIILVIGMQFSSAVSLYWTTMNIFAIIHEMMVRKKAERLQTLHGSGTATINSASS
ncbi:MAG: YidC/Oxa1 family membrane protein insertase [Patescibacteria group bacterium]